MQKEIDRILSNIHPNVMEFLGKHNEINLVPDELESAFLVIRGTNKGVKETNIYFDAKQLGLAMDEGQVEDPAKELSATILYLALSVLPGYSNKINEIVDTFIDTGEVTCLNDSL